MGSGQRHLAIGWEAPLSDNTGGTIHLAHERSSLIRVLLVCSYCCDREIVLAASRTRRREVERQTDRNSWADSKMSRSVQLVRYARGREHPSGMMRLIGDSDQTNNAGRRRRTDGRAGGQLGAQMRSISRGSPQSPVEVKLSIRQLMRCLPSLAVQCSVGRCWASSVWRSSDTLRVICIIMTYWYWCRDQ